MKYITHKNHSEYNQEDLRELLDPSSELKIVNLSEENNNVDLLYNAPRFTVMRENNGNPQNVNDDKLIACFNVDRTKMELLSDYDALPSEEYYVIDNLYVLKNSGFNKQRDKMDNFYIKYPGHYPVGVKRFNQITDFVLEPYSEDDMGELATASNCKIHMNWTNRDNASDIDTHVFVYKYENNALVYQHGHNGKGYDIDGHIYYPSSSGSGYRRYFSNGEIEVTLSWDDVTNNGDGNGRKGEYIKIKQNCSDEEYNKYYFVYVLFIYNGSSNYKAIWDDVKISITNNMYIKTDYTINTETINTETNQRTWGGFIIKNDNVLVQKDVFYGDVNTLINNENFIEWNYTVPGGGHGSGVAGDTIQITLPKINIDITEDVKSY